MCERRWPIFVSRNWACSCHQIPWRAEGHEGMRLGHLLADHGHFHNGHRAIDDCEALLAVLARPLRLSGRLALAGGESLRVTQGGASAVLPVRIDARQAANTVRVPAGHALTATLGPMFGPIAVEKA